MENKQSRQPQQGNGGNLYHYSRFNKVSDTNPKESECTMPELLDFLGTPVAELDITKEQFLALPKEERDKIKDKGCVVLGTFHTGSKRSSKNLEVMFGATVDIDHQTGISIDVVDKAMPMIIPNTAYGIYYSASNSPKCFCAHIVVPYDKPVSPNDHKRIANALKEAIEDELTIKGDDSNSDLARVFHLPIKFKGEDYTYKIRIANPLNVEEFLKEIKSKGEIEQSDVKAFNKELKDLPNPTTKGGWIGAFCSEYNVCEAIEKFLSDVYTKGEKGRYTLINGSSANGVLPSKDGNYVKSFHSTDIANNGHALNSYDLVRIHKCKGSIQKMNELCSNDEAVARVYRRQTFTDDMLAEIDSSWLDKLDMDKKGNSILSTSYNVCLIMDNDPKLKGNIWKNGLTETIMASKRLFWRARKEIPSDGDWEDSDSAALRIYLQKQYGIKGRDIIRDALMDTAEKHEIHPIRNYLKSLKWDGVLRLDELFIRCLGVEDTPLVRTITRMHLCAAAKRVHEAGCKYDYCVVFVGEQGVGKSSIIEILGGEYYNNSLYTLEGKEGLDQVRYGWLFEWAELVALRGSEVEKVKGFITTSKDRFRPAFAEHGKVFKRQCIFFATTNKFHFLRSDTGDRRFLPLDVDKDRRSKFFKTTAEMRKWLEENRDQIWAEAMYYYKKGDVKFYLSEEETSLMEQIQSDHNEREDDELFTKLEEYLETLLPRDWESRKKDSKRIWWENHDSNDITVAKGEKKRNRVCAGEYLWECFGFERGKHNHYVRDAGKVTNWLSRNPNWKKLGRLRIKGYGQATTFERVSILPEADENVEINPNAASGVDNVDEDEVL